uniref:Uncharacterized protein n=1 Tax=Seriola dumerili TaxID=41447 RepID=A0A3B4V081_SERDU
MFLSSPRKKKKNTEPLHSCLEISCSNHSYCFYNNIPQKPSVSGFMLGCFQVKNSLFSLSEHTVLLIENFHRHFLKKSSSDPCQLM